MKGRRERRGVGTGVCVKYKVQLETRKEKGERKEREREKRRRGEKTRMGCMQSFNVDGEDDGRKKSKKGGSEPAADGGALGEDVVFGYQTDIKSKYKVCRGEEDKK